MQAEHIRTLAEYIAELRRRGRDHNGAGQQPGFDTTIHENSDGSQGDRSGDGGCDQDQPG